ncbi:MAG: hypothetical protein DRH50_13825 [Deltaproteobacteria bacterium]|nr:MAG: hypothetical protein DRH50_13825 [Deltaproteobacteria bacterium]
MHKYSDIIESFPEEFQLPMLKLLDRLREETLDIVQKSDFEALRAAFSSLAEKVLELAEAQRRSEVRLERLEAAVEKLVEAQLRIEERLERLEGVVEELAEAQKRTEARIEELAEAQKRTEARIEELAEAQKRTEARIEELAEAQQKTEKILQGVLLEQKRFRKELGGISNTVGYTLENEAIKHLPGILQRDLGLKINVMDRRFIEYPDGKYDEINIYGEGVLDGEEVYVIGESKVQIGKRNLNAFERLLKRLSGYLRGRIIPVLVTHSVHPEVERFVKKKIEGLLIYKSFQLV